MDKEELLKTIWDGVHAMDDPKEQVMYLREILKSGKVIPWDIFSSREFTRWCSDPKVMNCMKEGK